MAQMSYEEFSRMNQNSNSTNTQTNNYRNSVSYFYLADDGDTAVVRFNIANIDDLKVTSRHSVTLNGKRRNVECIRNYNDPIDTCPLCASGSKPSFRVYLELLSYRIENGKVVSEAAIWDQPARFRETLKSYFMDYGDLRNIIFKITRHGRKGDTNTTYSLIVANPQVYKNEDYVADFSAFDTFDISRSMVLNKSAEELQYYVENGAFPETSTSQPSQPQRQMEEAARPVQPSYQQPVRQEVPPTTPIRTTYTTEAKSQEPPAQRGPRRYTY